MDDAKAIYEDTRMTLQGFLNAGRSARMALSSEYPMGEVDVDERVYESLEEDRHYETDPQPVGLYIAELSEIAARAPAGTEAVIEFEQDFGYDDDRIIIRKIGYWRDPTPAERAEREEHNRKAREHNAELERRRAAAELAEFERLKAKFEKERGT